MKCGVDSDLSIVRLRLFTLAVVLTLVGVASLVVIALHARELADFFEGRGILEVPIAIAAIAALATVLVPAGVLAGAAGFAFGTAIGFPAAMIGLTVGAMVAGALARFVGTERATNALGGRVLGLADWLEARPLRSVAVSRLIPGLPFSATSYACGLSSIPISTIALGTLLGFAPRAFAYTALGGSLGNLDSPEAKVAIVVSLAILLTLAVVPRAQRV
jgi:uncharacterized membrane protein YdjX (TVP38/TMEM64 family)